MRRTLSFMLAFVLAVWCSVCALAAPLQFNAQGKFRILLIADPQDDEQPEPDMAPMIETAIRQTQPNLIVVLGDLVEDDDVRCETDGAGVQHELPYAQVYENCRVALDAVFAPIIASGIPYTAVLGNNDYKSGVTAGDWLALLRAQPGLILPEQIDNSEGRIDNRLSVLSSDGREALRLFTMDTGKEGVTSEQLRWFQKHNDARRIPAMVFQHIPVSEAGYLWRFCFPWEEGAIARGKFFRLRLNTRIALGADHGQLWDGDISAQFLGWKTCGNVIGAYFGHVHNISVEGKWLGVRMGMVYSDRWNGAYEHGCAVLTFDENDVRAYTWTPYHYTGSVQTGDASLDEETYTPYTEYHGLDFLRYHWHAFLNYIRH